MEPEFDISSAPPFASTQAFEQAATTADKHGVQVYIPQRFVTKTDQLVADMPLDILTSALLQTVMAVPSAQDKEPDLGL